MGTILRKTPLLWVALLLLALAVALMALVATAGEAKAASVSPTPIEGNKTCKQLLNDPNAYEIKVDPPKDGTYGPVTVKFSADLKSVEFTSTVPVVSVFVKGGVIAPGKPGGNYYDYSANPVSSDSGLITPSNQQISHVSFCWTETPIVPDALTAEKTAEATYDRTITWDLTKTVDGQESVTHEGFAGDSFDSTWEVAATKEETEGNYLVTGVITITNPNDFDVPFSVTDTLDDGTDEGVSATVDCNPGEEGNQDSGTAPANGSSECSYRGEPNNRDATSNNALVTSGDPDVPGATAQADIDWVENTIGDDEVTLDDEYLTYSELISSNTTETFPETFTCPTEKSAYTNNQYTKEITNTATLTGDNTDLSATAKVTLECRYPWVGETATGAGQRYTNTSNWFMVTPYNPTGTANLIAGQHYDAGDITFVRNNGTTTITITLHDGFRFANVANNLKIQTFSTAQPRYMAPGQFGFKKTCSPAASTCTATVSNASYYGIHVDVERDVRLNNQ